MATDCVVGWKPTPPEVLRLRQSIDAETLCRKLYALSRETLPTGAGDVYAAVDNQKMGIWYSPSDLEREFVHYNALLLFKIREVNSGIVCMPETDPRIDELPYIPEKLLPKLIGLFTELHWTVNSC